MSSSSIYNVRNGYFKPGRALAVKIEELTMPRDKHGAPTGPSAVPVSSWEGFRTRPRPTGKVARR